MNIFLHRVSALDRDETRSCRIRNLHAEGA